MVCDLTDQIAVDGAWKRTAGIGLPVRYLVNNAGPAASTPMSVADGTRIAIGSYSSVANGFVETCGVDAASMTFTASIVGNFYVGATPDWYPAAKAGIAGLMRHLAVKYRGQPRSNGVAPAGIRTQRTASIPPEAHERIAKQPMGRMGEPNEVASQLLLAVSRGFVHQRRSGARRWRLNLDELMSAPWLFDADNHYYEAEDAFTATAMPTSRPMCDGCRKDGVATSCLAQAYRRAFLTRRSIRSPSRVCSRSGCRNWSRVAATGCCRRPINVDMASSYPFRLPTATVTFVLRSWTHKALIAACFSPHSESVSKG